MSDQPNAETSTWQHSQEASISPAGFEPAIPAGERPQNYALEREATGICQNMLTSISSLEAYRDSP